MKDDDEILDLRESINLLLDHCDDTGFSDAQTLNLLKKFCEDSLSGALPMVDEHGRVINRKN